MTFEKLAEMVRMDFKTTMEQEGFETFADMKRCYCWEAADIKDEVNIIIAELANTAYKNKEFSNFYMADDNSFIQIGVCEDMSWRDFKKLVFANL